MITVDQITGPEPAVDYFKVSPSRLTQLRSLWRIPTAAAG